MNTARLLDTTFYTTWPVITDAAYLLRDHPIAVAKLLNQLRNADLQFIELGLSDIDGISAILDAYSDQGFDLADAKLMHLADRENIHRVFTVDRRHFSLFRTLAGESLTLLP